METLDEVNENKLFPDQGKSENMSFEENAEKLFGDQKRLQENLTCEYQVTQISKSYLVVYFTL